MGTNRRVAAVSGVAQVLRDEGQRRAQAPLGQRLAAIPRMLHASWRGHYLGMGRGKLAGLAAAAFYIASPVDLMPEGVLLVFGLADDVLVGAWLAGSLLRAADDYLAWEASRPGPTPTTIPGEVVA